MAWTGARRGELCALPWADFDADAGTLRVERSLETTKAGLWIKSPKTRHGRRTISVPASVIEEFRAHWKVQQEQRLALGFGRVSVDDLIFAMADGSRYRPNTLPRDWPARHGGRRAANQPAQPVAPPRLKSHCGRDRRLDHQPPLGACQPLDHPLGVYGHLYRIPMIVRRRWSRRCLPASGRSSGGNPVAKPLFVPISFRRPHR
jgi:integrase